MLGDARISTARRLPHLFRLGCHFATGFLMSNLSAPHMFREAKSLSIRRRDDKHSLRTSGDCLGNDVERITI
jgi:hypothetical protein